MVDIEERLQTLEAMALDASLRLEGLKFTLNIPVEPGAAAPSQADPRVTLIEMVPAPGGVGVYANAPAFFHYTSGERYLPTYSYQIRGELLNDYIIPLAKHGRKIARKVWNADAGWYAQRFREVPLQFPGDRGWSISASVNIVNFYTPRQYYNISLHGWAHNAVTDRIPDARVQPDLHAFLLVGMFNTTNITMASKQQQNAERYLRVNWMGPVDAHLHTHDRGWAFSPDMARFSITDQRMPASGALVAVDMSTKRMHVSLLLMQVGEPLLPNADLSNLPIQLPKGFRNAWQSVISHSDPVVVLGAKVMAADE